MRLAEIHTPNHQFHILLVIPTSFANSTTIILSKNGQINDF